MREFTTPDSADLLRAGRGLEALQRVKDQMPAWQLMARIWPGQFREAVAHLARGNRRGPAGLAHR
jgi:hypothetical protein